MLSKPKPTANQQIRTLLIVLGVGVISAFAFAAFLLYTYGPSGSYALKDVLLSPSLLQELSFRDQDPRTGGTARFVFDSMEYSYRTTDSREWRRIPVSMARYETLYRELLTDKSEVKVPENAAASFTQSPPSSLIITVKTLSNDESKVTSKIFQEIQFSKDIYRVELRDQTPSMGTWAYFYHPYIQLTSINLLGEL